MDTHFLVGGRSPGGWRPFGIFAAETPEAAVAEAAPDMGTSPEQRKGFRMDAQPVKPGDWVRLKDGRAVVLCELGMFHSWLLVAQVNGDGSQGTPFGVATERIAEVLEVPRDGLGHMALPGGRGSICRADNGTLVHFSRLVGCPRCKAVLDAPA